MSSTMSSRLAGAAVAVMVLAGCATTVAGNPTAAGRGSSTEPTEQTPSTEPTETTESGTDEGDLSCEGEDVVAPEGQPFCFTIPAGFRQNDIDIETQAGSTASFTTGVVLSERDLIIFSVYPLGLDSDDASDRDLIDALATVIAQLDAAGFDFTETEPLLLEVDGARAFFYTGSDATGLHIDTYFIFRGAVELQVNCQWETMEADVLTGCENVLDSLQITG